MLHRTEPSKTELYPGVGAVSVIVSDSKSHPPKSDWPLWSSQLLRYQHPTMQMGWLSRVHAQLEPTQGIRSRLERRQQRQQRH